MEAPASSARRAGQRALVWFLFPAAVSLVLAALLAWQVDEELPDLFREATVTGELPIYTGVMATLTVMVWTAAAAAALVVVGISGPWEGVPGLLRCVGLLTLALAADDAFQGHDGLVQMLGIPGELLLALYGVAVPVMLWLYRDQLRSAETVVLLGALGLLAGSLLVDVAHERLPGTLALGDSVRVFVEDGAKLLGAAAWLAYAVQLGRRVRAAE